MKKAQRKEVATERRRSRIHLTKKMIALLLIAYDPAVGKLIGIQCDGGCEGWFHMHCVGLDRTEIAEEDDYICSNCKEAEQNSTSRAPDPLAESLGLDALLSLSQSQGYQGTDSDADIQETTSFVRTY